MTDSNRMNSPLSSVGASQAEKPPFLRDLPDARVTTLDVRPILARGDEPFRAIMEAAERTGLGEALKLVAPFEPVPLYAVLVRKGFSYWRRSPPAVSDTWEIFFFREGEEPLRKPDAAETLIEGDGGEEMMDLDVRGLEAPEPMEMVLEALEQMNYGTVLRVRHHREPLILFDVLAERGFAYRSKQLASDEWEIRIWRKR